MLKQLKFNAIILLLLLLGILVYQLFYLDIHLINVKPLETLTKTNYKFDGYDSATIIPFGKINIEHLGIWRKVFAPISNSDFQTSNLLFTIICIAIFLIIISSSERKGDNNKARITNRAHVLFNIIGYGVLCINFINHFRDKYFDSLIRDITQNQFALEETNDKFFYILMIALLFIWIGRIFKSAAN